MTPGSQRCSDDEAKAKTNGPSILFDELRQRMAAGGVAFDFNLQLAQPSGRIDSAAVPLPEVRRKRMLGRLSIKLLAADGGRGRAPGHHLRPDTAAPGRRAFGRPAAAGAGRTPPTPSAWAGASAKAPSNSQHGGGPPPVAGTLMAVRLVRDPPP